MRPLLCPPDGSSGHLGHTRKHHGGAHDVGSHEPEQRGEEGIENRCYHLKVDDRMSPLRKGAI